MDALKKADITSDTLDRDFLKKDISHPDNNNASSQSNGISHGINGANGHVKSTNGSSNGTLNGASNGTSNSASNGTSNGNGNGYKSAIPNGIFSAPPPKPAPFHKMTPDFWRLETVDEAASFIRSRLPASFPAPEVGVVCGSGCGAIADALVEAESFRFEDIPHFLPTAVDGHKGILFLF